MRCAPHRKRISNGFTAERRLVWGVVDVDGGGGALPLKFPPACATTPAAQVRTFQISRGRSHKSLAHSLAPSRQPPRRCRHPANCSQSKPTARRAPKAASHARTQQRSRRSPCGLGAHQRPRGRAGSGSELLSQSKEIKWLTAAALQTEAETETETAANERREVPVCSFRFSCTEIISFAPVSKERPGAGWDSLVGVPAARTGAHETDTIKEKTRLNNPPGGSCC
jgi:hypothetical protein